MSKDQILSYLTVWQSRITLGLAFVGAVVIGLWPDHDRNLDIEKLVACIVAGAAWLAAELGSAVREPSAHDIALFDRIQSLLDDDALIFLKEQDFAVNFHGGLTAPVNQIAQWHGPNYVFNDSAIQARWEKTSAKIQELSGLYVKTLVGTDKPEIVTAWLLGYPRHNQPEHAKAEVEALNVTASQVYQDFSEFVIFVRKRLGL